MGDKLSQVARAVAGGAYNRNSMGSDVGGSGMGRLTTHILDTAQGRPAANVSVRFYALRSDDRELVASGTSNEDGRMREPLLADEALATGSYEMEFDIGAYFRAQGVTLAEPAFLDTVVIRFSIRADEDYHVPLLVSPWSYATYRGS